MATYRIKAYDEKGRGKQLSLEASSAQEAYKIIKAWGYLPGEVRKEWAVVSFIARPFRAVTINDMVLLLRQLAYALKAGFSLQASLKSIQEDQKQASHAQFLAELHHALDRGLSFSQAIESSSFPVPQDLLQWARIGEKQGRLPESLLEVSTMLEDQQRIKKKMRQSLAYPGLVFILSMVVSFFLLFVLLPILAETYFDLSGEVPFFMSFLLILRRILGISFLFFILLFIYLFLEKREQLPFFLKEGFQKLFEQIPYIKDVFDWSIYLPFARTFSSLLDAGIPLEESMGLLMEQSGSKKSAQELAHARESLSKGESIPDALEACSFIPPTARGFIRLGDQTGQLPATMAMSASMVEEQWKRRLETISKAIEPLAILFLGGVVLFVALAFFLPLLDSYALYLR